MSHTSRVWSLLAVALAAMALAIAPVCAGAPRGRGLSVDLDRPAPALVDTPPMSEELFYDDGTCEGYHNLRAAAVRFSITERRQVMQLKYYLKGASGPVQLFVYNANWAVQYAAQVTPGPLDIDSYHWWAHDVSGEVVVEPGDFYVAMVWPKAGAGPHLGEDTTPPHAGRSHGSWDGAQPPFASLGSPPLDLMIRAVVQQPAPPPTNTPRPWGGRLSLPVLVRQPTPPGPKISAWPMAGYDSGNTCWNKDESVLYPPLHVLWQYGLPANIDYLESVTIDAGKVLLSGVASGENPHLVVGLDAESGDPLWRFDLTGGGGSMGIQPAIYGGLAFFGGQSDDRLYAVDIQTGQLRWQKTGMVGMYDRDPIVDHGILYVSSWGGQPMSIMAINPEQGDTLWELLGESRQSDYVVDQGVLMRAGTYGEPIIGVNVATGAIIWRTLGRAASYLAAGNGLVFAEYTGDDPVRLPEYPYYVYDRVAAFSVADGSKVWETLVDADLKYGQLALGDNALYLLRYDWQNPGSTLYVFDPATGELLNERSYGPKFTHLVGANQVIYLCGDALQALDARDLRQLWSAQIGGCWDISVARGKLYVLQPGPTGLVAYGP